MTVWVIAEDQVSVHVAKVHASLHQQEASSAWASNACNKGQDLLSSLLSHWT